MKEAIICSTGDSAATTVGAGPSASTSTAPTQISRDAGVLPVGLPSSPFSAARSPSKRRHVKSPLHNARSPGHLLMRALLLSVDQEGVVPAHCVHQNRVLGLAVAVSPKAGPQPDPKPVQAQDLSTQEQRQSKLLKSSPEIKPVEVRMMSWTLQMRQMCPKAVCPCLTSPPPIMRIPANAKHTSLRRNNTDFAAWKDKLIKEGVKGIQERDSTVNDYTDGGKRRPKNPDPLGPLFPI